MNKPPLKIGITGGIGSGKSHVAGVLRRWGIPVYDTDREAKRLMQESADIRRGLTALLGSGAYGADEKYAATGSCLSIFCSFITLPILMLLLG